MTAAVQTPPKWMAIALAEVGVREVAGGGDNARVIEYLSTTGLPAEFIRDQTAWCSAFANWCMKQAGIEGTGSAAARSWLAWGTPLKTPRYGCVVILWRKKADSPFGHVAFYAGDRGRSVMLLGGNQGDAVSLVPYSKSRVLGYRWPT